MMMSMLMVMVSSTATRVVEKRTFYKTGFATAGVCSNFKADQAARGTGES